jgi:hypothetical protein
MKSIKQLVPSTVLLFLIACNLLAPRPIPTPTSTPIPLSQQVTLVSQLLDETNQTPPFTIKSRIPQLAGSDDPRVASFNQRLNELVTNEVNTWRESFLQVTLPTATSGSFLEASHTLISQLGEVWSFKFDFHFYSDGAAHPGSYSITMNYDLGQGRELALDDIFLPNSDYLNAISNYCITELSKQPFFDSAFTTGADPAPENYRSWNITSEGLLITFDEYQVAPYAAGPQQVLVPYGELRAVIDPQGSLVGFIQ